MFGIRNLVLFLFTILLVQTGHTSTKEELWAEGLEAWNASKFQEAEEKFSTWIESASQEGIHSAEAHQNLALSLLRQEKTAPAVEELLVSARLKLPTSSQWEILDQVYEIQKELGITESATGSMLWRLSFGFNTIAKTILAGLILVLLSTALAIRLLFPLQKPLSNLFFSGAGIFALFFIALLLHQNLSGETTAVIASQDNQAEIPVFSNPESVGSGDAEKEKPVAQIPTGVVVTYYAKSGDFVQLQSPVAGWVPSSALRNVF